MADPLVDKQSDSKAANDYNDQFKALYKVIPPRSIPTVGRALSRAIPGFNEKRTIEVSEDGTRRGTLMMVHQQLKEAPDLLSSVPGYSFTTLYELFNETVERSPEFECLGKRKPNADGSAGPFEFETYKQIQVRRNNFGSGLATLGIQAGSNFGIYSKNKVEWLVAEFGGHSRSAVTVPLYDTLGADSVEYVINHAELSVVICTAEKIDHLCDLHEKCPQLKHLVSIGSITEEQKKKADEVGISLQTFEEIEKIGEEKPEFPIPPKPEDLFTIMYTSGSTGVPKGVPLTHANLVACIAGCTSVDAFPDMGYPLTYLSYLPLAHVIERSAIYNLLTTGTRIGFFQGLVPKLFEDIKELNPDLLVGVPRVYQLLYTKVKGAIASSGWLKRTMFGWAYAGKLAALKAGKQGHWLWDPLVFNKLKERIGSNISMFLSAGAPLDPQVAEFIAVAFSGPASQAYGLTETSGGMTFGFCNDFLNKLSVGPPTACVEIKLRDVPDMGYKTTDVPCPRGEILIRGPSIFSGYYKDPKTTKEALTEDGFMITGDVGMWEADGSLSIIDRIKNLIKLQQGEYVALEMVESVYTRSMLVGQIYVHGGPFSRYLVGVVVPDEEALMKLASEKRIEGEFEDLVKNEEIAKDVLDSMDSKAVEAELKGFEKVKMIHLTAEAFTVENDLITPTFKLRRKQAKDKYGEVCEAMLAKLE